MSQTSFDLINLITKNGAFSNVGEFYKASEAQREMTKNGYVVGDGVMYTLGRVGTAPDMPGVITKPITRSFTDFLRYECGVPEGKEIDARRTLSEASRLGLI